MSLKARLQPFASSLLTSPRTRDLLRQVQELKRRIGGQPHTVTVWLKLDDPYSYLLLQVLPLLEQHFNIRLELRFIGPLAPDMFPAPEPLRHYALADSARLASLHQLSPAGSTHPEPAHVQLGNRILLACEPWPAEQLLPVARQVFTAVWQQENTKLATLAERFTPLPTDEADFLLLAARDDLTKAGHYLPATLQYGGEWYWGVDRLGYLCERLQALGAARVSHPFVLTDADPQLDNDFLINDWEHLTTARALTLPLDFYFSFRSPYSYLALQRVFDLCDHYQLRLQVRPVLPMVMRGLPVPRSKRFYILQDARREADRLGIPFGHVCDPVGPGVERCMALLPHARNEGRERAYLASVSRGIWSEGRNVADDRVLASLLERAGLDWDKASPWLQNNDWRQAEAEDRESLQQLGLWGVPGLHLQLPGKGHLALWGQDRLWALEAAIADCLHPASTNA